MTRAPLLQRELQQVVETACCSHGHVLLLQQQHVAEVEAAQEQGVSPESLRAKGAAALEAVKWYERRQVEVPQSWMGEEMRMRLSGVGGA